MLQPATPAAAQDARPWAWALATHFGGASHWQHVALPPAAPFATAAQFRAIPRAGRAASVARPRDAPASRPGGRAPLPFGRGKAHPGDRKGHARLVALTDHAVDGPSRTTTRRRTSRSCRRSRRTTTSPPRWRRSITVSPYSDGDTCHVPGTWEAAERGACVCVPARVAIRIRFSKFRIIFSDL